MLGDTQEIGEEVKHKISLRYDKIELEQKLAEMAQTINNFKTTYGVTSETVMTMRTTLSNTDTALLELEEQQPSSIAMEDSKRQ